MTACWKCLHGKMQNQNEALNGMIWQCIPKEVQFRREILEMGLFLSCCILVSNIGSSAIQKLFGALGIPPGTFTESGYKQLDHACVHLAQRKNHQSTKKEKKSTQEPKKKER